ncbi:MAG TPA: recombinase family protein [Candidatus Acidoferrum sp.]|nr:recombinase family protein [Candidatus Acidoferrum sp.]
MLERIYSSPRKLRGTLSRPEVGNTKLCPSFRSSSDFCTPNAEGACYAENESGGKLARPELFRLLDDSQPGDILLVEQVDRLSRLTTADWVRLKAELMARRVRVVALDLPTSWMMATSNADEFTGRMFEAINGMLLDMLAAVARKDYDDRRRRGCPNFRNN